MVVLVKMLAVAVSVALAVALVAIALTAITKYLLIWLGHFPVVISVGDFSASNVCNFIVLINVLASPKHIICIGCIIPNGCTFGNQVICGSLSLPTLLKSNQSNTKTYN